MGGGGCGCTSEKGVDPLHKKRLEIYEETMMYHVTQGLSTASKRLEGERRAGRELGLVSENKVTLGATH